MRKPDDFLYDNVDLKLNEVQNFNRGDFWFYYRIVDDRK